MKLRPGPWLPVAVALFALAGSLSTTLFLDRAAREALDRVLTERLLGAGQTAAALFAGAPATPLALKRLMAANALDGAYVVTPSLRLEADATGAAGRRVDLLRVDLPREARALAGEPSVGHGYSVGGVEMAVGYFPITRADGTVRAVLALEAGQAFAKARLGIRRATRVGEALSVLVALLLGLFTWRWARSERARSLAATQAARGETLARVAAMAAHEIRNPLMVIRGTVELMRERAGPQLSERNRDALQDVLGEVERLRGLTEDLLDLSADRPLALAQVALHPVVAAAVEALAITQPQVAVSFDLQRLPPVDADERRLRQVFANLLANAAEAGARRIQIAGEEAHGGVALSVTDDGPGIPAALRTRLFEPFATSKAHGTGVGLALSRRMIERHGGTLNLRPDGTGAAFALWLPLPR